MDDFIGLGLIESSPSASDLPLVHSSETQPPTVWMLQASLPALCRDLVNNQECALVKRFADLPLHATLPLFTVGGIAATVYATLTTVYMPALQIHLFSQQSLVIHAGFAMLFGSYYQGVVLDPGGIPDCWKGDPDSVHEFMTSCDLVERKKNGSYRYCNKEQKFKPDRAHFCRAMKRNVLRMDHYCPWLANCVGHYNHKFFFLCLLYSSLLADDLGCSFLWTLLHVKLSGVQTFLLIQGTAISGMLGLVITPFLFFHLWLLTQNLTTIEFCEKRGSDGDYASPYDRGVRLNIKSVLGDCFLLWLFPVGGPSGSGIEWPKRQSCEDCAEVEEEPPYDFSLKPDPAKSWLLRFVPGAWVGLKECAEDLEEGAASFADRLWKATQAKFPSARGARV